MRTSLIEDMDLSHTLSSSMVLHITSMVATEAQLDSIVITTKILKILTVKFGLSLTTVMYQVATKLQSTLRHSGLITQELMLTLDSLWEQDLKVQTEQIKISK